jgi:hypothetical protein
MLNLGAALGLLLALSLLANPAAAQEPLVTDRPDFTESAAVIERGHFQLEGGTTFTRADETDEHALGEILLRIGIAPRLELRVGANSYAWVDHPEGDVDGFEDATLGAKVLLSEGRVASALLLGTSVPTGSHGIGAEAWEPEVKIALARDVGVASVGANAGWFWSVADDERLHGTVGSLTVGLPLGERGGLFLETYGIAVEGAGGEEAYADAGVTRLLSDDLQLDARVGVGLGGEAADWYVGAGVSRRW